jgi:hypothetical protein
MIAATSRRLPTVSPPAARDGSESDSTQVTITLKSAKLIHHAFLPAKISLMDQISQQTTHQGSHLVIIICPTERDDSYENVCIQTC